MVGDGGMDGAISIRPRRLSEAAHRSLTADRAASHSFWKHLGRCVYTRRVHKDDTTDIATIDVFSWMGGHEVWRAGYAGVGCYRDQHPEGLRQGPAKNPCTDRWVPDPSPVRVCTTPNRLWPFEPECPLSAKNNRMRIGGRRGLRRRRHSIHAGPKCQRPMQGNAVPDPLHRSHLPRGRCGRAKTSSEGDVVAQNCPDNFGY
ncbi:hypothetical protein TcG_11941 [Trypanosoma cruzi]|nr:hypothetical protein TcG_11941 [Trypanosoma cruzi]